MEAILSIVLAGLLFRARGTGPATRGCIILATVVACFYDSPALHNLTVARIWLALLALTLVVWISDLVRARRRGPA